MGYTSMDWERLILDAVEDLGDPVHLSNIYLWLERNAPLTDEHLRATRHGGRPAYQHQVRSHISNLCQRGALVRVDVGMYASAVR